jgi:hypothetical protein
MSNQDLSEALSSNYMLVSLSIRTWSGKRTDKDATSEVISNKNAAKDSGSFVKKLLASADEELRDVLAESNAMRSFLYANTLPWSLSTEGAKRGERLVPTANAMTFLRDVAEIKKRYDAAVLNLQSVWDARVTQAITNLGGLANPSDYPPAHDLPALFSVQVDIRPVSAVNDFTRLSVPAALQTALASRMASQMETQMKNAMEDLRERLLEELNRIATQLGKVGAGEKTKLYETLITNTQNLVALARNMNLSGSQKLIELADKIEAKLLSHPIEVYKQDVTRAATAAQEAKALIDEATADGVFY